MTQTAQAMHPSSDIEPIMREFVSTLSERDIDKTLAYFTEGAEWTTPQGTFYGHKEIKRYLGWQKQMNVAINVIPSGLEVIAEGNKAFFEHKITGTTKDGSRYELLAICAYEFDGDKIKKIRSTYDCLSLAKQAAKGIVAPLLINLISKKTEEGL